MVEFHFRFVCEYLYFPFIFTFYIIRKSNLDIFIVMYLLKTAEKTTH